MATSEQLQPVKGKAGDFVRWRSKNRDSGTMVGVYDRKGRFENDELGVEFPGGAGRFAIRCENHDTTTHVDSLTDAWQAMAHPGEFCDKCKAAHTTKDGVPTAASVLKAPMLVGKRSAPQAKVVLDEATAWQEWAMTLADNAPPGTVVAWLGDYKYAIMMNDQGCSVDVLVSPTTGKVKYRADGCLPASANHEYDDLQAALAGIGFGQCTSCKAKVVAKRNGQLCKGCLDKAEVKAAKKPAGKTAK